MEKAKNHYTAKELAEKIGVTPRSIQKKMKRGDIPGAYKTSDASNAHWRVPRHEGDEYLMKLGINPD